MPRLDDNRVNKTAQEARLYIDMVSHISALLDPETAAIRCIDLTQERQLIANAAIRGVEHNLRVVLNG
jgi:hypothetical protein